jgi:hypothetical protein
MSGSFPYPFCNKDACYAVDHDNLLLTNCSATPTLTTPITESSSKCNSYSGYHFMLDYPGHTGDTHRDPYTMEYNYTHNQTLIEMYCAADTDHDTLMFNKSEHGDVCTLAAGHFNCCSEKGGEGGRWACDANKCNDPDFVCCFNDYPHGQSHEYCFGRNDTSNTTDVIKAYSDDVPEWPNAHYTFLHALWDIDNNTMLSKETVAQPCVDLDPDGHCGFIANNNCQASGSFNETYIRTNCALKCNMCPNPVHWTRFSDYLDVDPDGEASRPIKFVLAAFNPNNVSGTIHTASADSAASVCDLAYNTLFNNCFAWGDDNITMCTSYTHFASLNSSFANRIKGYKVCTISPSKKIPGRTVRFKRLTSENPSFFDVTERYPQNFDNVDLRYQDLNTHYLTDTNTPGHLCDYAVKEASYCYFTTVTNLGNLLECTAALKDASAFHNATCCFNDYKVAPNCAGGDINHTMQCDYDSGDGTVYYKAIAGTTQFYVGARKGDADIQLVCLSAEREPPVLFRRCAAYDPDYPCCDDNGRCHPANKDGNCDGTGGRVCTQVSSTAPPTPPPPRASRPNEDAVIGIAVGSGVGAVLIVSCIAYWSRWRKP